MLSEYYIYMIVLYFVIAFARKKEDIKISLFGAFLVATLTKLSQISNLLFFHTVIYEVVMFIISYFVLRLTFNFKRMGGLVYIVEVVVAILLVYIYVNLGMYIYSM